VRKRRHAIVGKRRKGHLNGREGNASSLRYLMMAIRLIARITPLVPSGPRASDQALDS